MAVVLHVEMFCICQIFSASELESRTAEGLVRGHAYSIIGLAEVQKNGILFITHIDIYCKKSVKASLFLFFVG